LSVEGASDCIRTSYRASIVPACATLLIPHASFGDLANPLPFFLATVSKPEGYSCLVTWRRLQRWSARVWVQRRVSPSSRQWWLGIWRRQLD